MRPYLLTLLLLLSVVTTGLSQANQGSQAQLTPQVMSFVVSDTIYLDTPDAPGCDAAQDDAASALSPSERSACVHNAPSQVVEYAFQTDVLVVDAR